jgi:hypothetical protein
MLRLRSPARNLAAVRLHGERDMRVDDLTAA